MSALKALENVACLQMKCIESTGKQCDNFIDECTERTGKRGNCVDACTTSTPKCGILEGECTKNIAKPGVHQGQCTERKQENVGHL